MQMPPSMRMWQLATGHFLPRCLHVVAELGIADHLSEQAVSTEALGSATGADAVAIGRMLRLLATADIFAPSGGGWVHTELSRLLRSDHPQSMRAFVRMIGGRMQWGSAGELEHAARTGQAAVEHLAKVPDIVMLSVTGGCERTHDEYRALFAAAGFRLDRVVPTRGPISVLVGAPA